MPWGFQACQSQWYKFQSCMMICFWQNTFWDKTSLLFVFRGPNSVYTEVIRHANHNGTSFKAVWWSVSDKTHFGIKHHFSLYLQGQTPLTLRFSGMPITMLQVSKLYDDLFLTKHILGWSITFLCIYRAKFSTPWGFQACQSQWYKFQSCMMICF